MTTMGVSHLNQCMLSRWKLSNLLSNRPVAQVKPLDRVVDAHYLYVNASQSWVTYSYIVDAAMSSLNVHCKAY